MKIYSNADIRAIEAASIALRGIDRLTLCREASVGMADYVENLAAGRPIVVMAGPEQCGAYALELTSRLCERGADVTTYLFNVGGNRLTPDCDDARMDLLANPRSGNALIELTAMQMVLPELDENMVVVDGLFGIEHPEPLAGGYRHVVRYINESGATVVSLDLPTGLTGDERTGLIDRNIVHATVTIAPGMPRRAFFLEENAELVGTWHVVPIKIPHKAFDGRDSDIALVERSEVAALLPSRSPFCSKHDFGHAMLFAGSHGMMGAAVLAARAALRSGVGRLTVHGPRCGYFVLQTAVPSAMYSTDRSDAAISRIEPGRYCDAVAIGPGIGRADVTVDALDAFLKLADANSRPAVLDADALNCMALRPTMLRHTPLLSVLTPHSGEFDRLFGPHPTSEARLDKACRVAAEHKVIIVLKGHYTAVVRPDGKIYLNPTGTPALATAGSGDVLTGTILGLMAQGLAPELAAVAAVYVHGVAGRIAAETHGERGVTAEDIAENIGRAIERVTSPTQTANYL